MRLISSRSTFITKRVFPVAWFGFLALFVAISVANIGTKQEFPAPFLIFPVFMGVFGYFLMKKMVFDLVDEVWDAGAELVVKNKGAEEHLPLSEIMNISYSSFTSPQRVTLSIRRPTLFGTEITFVPPARFVPFAKSPIVDELIQRVDAARRR
jgi:hypothetical protein